MQDLGRAKTNEQAQKEIADNPHYMSYVEWALTFQANQPHQKTHWLGSYTGGV